MNKAFLFSWGNFQMPVIFGSYLLLLAELGDWWDKLYFTCLGLFIFTIHVVVQNLILEDSAVQIYI